MRKTVFRLCALMLSLLCLGSCGGAGESVLTINGSTEIGDEIFAYFLNQAYYGEFLRDEQAIENATSKCLEYTAVNTRFAQMGGKLTSNQKAEISLEVNALWRIWGAYLTEIGVSKDAFFKIKQYEYCKEDLRFALYDDGGAMEISEAYIRQYFTENYVGIKFFYEELYTPVSDERLASMTESQRQQYESERTAASDRYDYISGIANYVNSGVYTIDEAFMAVTGEVSADISVSATVIGRDGGSFPQEFIDAVFKQAVGSAFIITNSAKSYMYFIERVDLMDDEYSFYADYRDDCLVSLSESYFITEISSWIQSYGAVRRMNAARRCLDKIESVDRSEYVGTEDYQFLSLEAR